MLKVQGMGKVWERAFLPQEWKPARPTEHSNRLNLLSDCGCWLFLTPVLPTPQGHYGTCQECTRRLAAGTARDSRDSRHHPVLGSAARPHSPLQTPREQTPAVPVPRLKPLGLYRVLIHLDSNLHRLHAPALCSHTSHIVIKMGIYQ